METKTIELHSKDELLKACLTKSQRCKASKLYDEMSHMMGRFEEDYEMKKAELTYYEGYSFISIYLEHGMKNDEGTLAQAFARDRAQCFISPRGKLNTTTTKLKTIMFLVVMKELAQSFVLNIRRTLWAKELN